MYKKIVDAGANLHACGDDKLVFFFTVGADCSILRSINRSILRLHG